MDGSIWSVWGGVGLFMAGIWMMEAAISQLAGRNVKILLRKNTSNNFRALLTGTVTTAILQSSSVVSFLTLAFTGSGLIQLQNALAVILGANVGTTLANWIIASFGFRFDIEMLWLPIMGLAGIGVFVFSEKKKNLFDFSRFLLGLSFLFIALGFMKQGMSGSVNAFDFSLYNGYPSIVFVAAGFVITFLIQSSNATMAIALSALYAGVIPFATAVAVVIGSELGTSLKLLLASAGGAADKRKVATANIILNGSTTILAYAAMQPLILLVTETLQIQDPLQALVAFQFVINLASAILFFPFLGALSKSLERMFSDGDGRAAMYLDAAVPGLPGLAMEIFRLEVKLFLKRVLAYNAWEFNIDQVDIGLDKLFSEKERMRESKPEHLKDRYGMLKKTQGELIEYYVKMQKQLSRPEDHRLANHWMQSAHEAMHAAKGFKDIHHNRNELLQSGNDLKFNQLPLFGISIRQSLAGMASALREENKPVTRHELVALLSENQKEYAALLQEIYTMAGRDKLPEKDISTLQNMNRELFSAHRAFIYALGDFLLEPSDSLQSVDEHILT